MITMLQRLKWNSRGWKAPSGNIADGGYPGRTGYGHEEWNFQIEDSYCGFLYAYIYYIPSAKIIKESGGNFRIGFWSLHPQTKEKLLVGFYKRACSASDKELKDLYDYFEANGIFRRRAEELISVVPSISLKKALGDLRRAVREKWIDWKCSVDDAVLLPHYIPIPNKIDGKIIGGYFSRPTFVRNIPFMKGNYFITPKEKRGKRSAPLAEDAYYRESVRNLKIILPRHNKLSNEFCRWLRTRKIYTSSQEKNNVDVVFKVRRITYMAEIKICYSVGTTRSIREALGQLLEYNHYPRRKANSNWLIVLDQKPLREDLMFLRNLRNRLSLPVYLCWKSKKGFDLENDVSLKRLF